MGDKMFNYEDKFFNNKLKHMDKHLFEWIFKTYYKQLVNFVYGLCFNIQLSEDIVQEIMIMIWTKRKHLTITISLKGYLYKACFNKYLMHRRKEKRKLTLMEEIKSQVLLEALREEETEYEELLFQKLRDLIKTLPPKRQKVFVLSRYEKMKNKDIALLLDISVKGVEAHISKSMAYLKKVLCSSPNV